MPHPINHSLLLALQDIGSIQLFHILIAMPISWRWQNVAYDTVCTGCTLLANMLWLFCQALSWLNIAVTISLNCTFMFHLPYKFGDGVDYLIAIAASTDVVIINILGLPFIIAMKMIVDFVDMIAMFNTINHPPFPIKLQIISSSAYFKWQSQCQRTCQ